MRILYACHQFFPEYYTGTERYTLELAKQMQRFSHYVEVLTYAHLSADGMAGAIRNDILVKKYLHENVPVTAWRHRDYGDHYERSFVLRGEDEALEACFEDYLHKHPFDLVHLTHLMRVTPIINVAKRHGLPTVMHLVDYWMCCPKVNLLRLDGSLCDGSENGRQCLTHCFGPADEAAILQRFERNQSDLESVDVVVSPSQYLIDVFAQHGFKTENFIYCPHGFNYDHVPFVKQGKLANENTIVFGYLGTLVPHKGVDVLIKAFRRLPHNNARLHIYGGCFEQHDYQRSLQVLAEGDARIEFRGEYEFEQLASLMQSIDVAAVPSTWVENAPLVISSAHAFGVPVITTQLGGMAEMVKDGVAGLTFNYKDVAHLAEKLDQIASSPNILTSFSDAIVPPPRIESDAWRMASIYSELSDIYD